MKALLGAGALFLTAATAPPWLWNLPGDMPPPPVPTDNAMSNAKVELGRRLFYDADLSLDGTLACAGCHEQKRAFADATRRAPVSMETPVGATRRGWPTSHGYRG